MINARNHAYTARPLTHNADHGLRLSRPSLTGFDRSNDGSFVYAVQYKTPER